MEDLLQRTRNRIIWVFLGVATIGIVISAGIQFSKGPDLSDWIVGLLQNAATEVLGAVAVLYLVDRTFDNLRAKADRQREKDDLIFQMGNPNDSAAALEAVRRLRGLGYLADGSLRGKIIHWTKLQTADLKEADLRGADLGGTDFTKASLWYANLQGAKLGRAILVDAELGGAQLQGADLQEAKLQGAKLNADTTFDERTILPNGKHWTPDTDMDAITKKTTIRVETKVDRWA